MWKVGGIKFESTLAQRFFLSKKTPKKTAILKRKFWPLLTLEGAVVQTFEIRSMSDAGLTQPVFLLSADCSSQVSPENKSTKLVHTAMYYVKLLQDSEVKTGVSGGQV